MDGYALSSSNGQLILRSILIGTFTWLRRGFSVSRRSIRHTVGGLRSSQACIQCFLKFKKMENRLPLTSVNGRVLPNSKRRPIACAERRNEDHNTYLVNYMTTHSEFAAGRFSTATGTMSFNDQWVRLSDALNKLGPAKPVDKWKKVYGKLLKLFGPHFPSVGHGKEHLWTSLKHLSSWDGLVWADMKSRVKGKASKVVTEKKKTGNRALTAAPLPVEEHRILGVTGPTAALGHNEFHDSMREPIVVYDPDNLTFCVTEEMNDEEMPEEADRNCLNLSVGNFENEPIITVAEGSSVTTEIEKLVEPSAVQPPGNSSESSSFDSRSPESGPRRLNDASFTSLRSQRQTRVNVLADAKDCFENIQKQQLEIQKQQLDIQKENLNLNKRMLAMLERDVASREAMAVAMDSIANTARMSALSMPAMAQALERLTEVLQNQQQ